MSRLIKAEQEVTDEMLKELSELEYNHFYKEIDFDKINNIEKQINDKTNKIMDLAYDIKKLIKDNEDIFNAEAISSFSSGYKLNDIDEDYKILRFIADDDSFKEQFDIIKDSIKLAKNNKDEIIKEQYENLKNYNLSLENYKSLKEKYSK